MLYIAVSVILIATTVWVAGAISTFLFDMPSWLKIMAVSFAIVMVLGSMGGIAEYFEWIPKTSEEQMEKMIELELHECMRGPRTEGSDRGR